MGARATGLSRDARLNDSVNYLELFRRRQQLLHQAIDHNAATS
jgi:hypothetical protein